MCAYGCIHIASVNEHMLLFISFLYVCFDVCVVSSSAALPAVNCWHHCAYICACVYAFTYVFFRLKV